MSFKLLIAVALLALVSVNVASACKCRLLPDPGYCRTDFAAVVRIKDVTVIDEKKHYSFEILHDLSYGKAANKLGQFADIQTNSQTAACGKKLFC